MTRTVTAAALMSLFTVTTIGVITACGVTVHAQTYPHHQYTGEPTLINIGVEDRYFDAQAGVPHCLGYSIKSPRNVYLIRGEGSWPCEWQWMPYPRDWLLTDQYIYWVMANWVLDGNLDGVPDYKQFDYGGDGYVNVSDLSFFGQDYGAGKRWMLPDFAAMGQIYNARRAE